MTELTYEIMKNYQVRKTREQKTAFIELLKRYFPDMRVETGGMLKCRNIVIGDVENADVVFGAHYDTCKVLPVPNILLPKRPILFMLYQFLILIPLLLASLASLVGVLMVTGDFLVSWLAMVVVYGMGGWFLFGGRANTHTANDNTSGVVTLCEAYKMMEPGQRRNAAFVFFDHEETGLWGSSLFRRMHRCAMREKLLVNFDCVSDGDHFLIIAGKKARVKYGEELRSAFSDIEGKCVRLEKAATTLFPSDQMRFPCSVGVAALKRKRMIGLYLDRIHTKHDTVFREENIAYFAESICRLSAEIEKRRVIK